MDVESHNLLEYLLYAVVGMASAMPLLLLNVKFAPRLGLIDWPKARGVAQAQVPLIGHSLVILAISTLFLVNRYFELSPWFVLTTILIGIMGHLDDRRPLPALDKLFFQIVCVCLVVYLDPQIKAAVTDKYGFMGGVVASFFVLGLMNAVNFIDGIDGLASIVLAVGALGLVLLSLSSGSLSPYAICGGVIMGSMVPFFYLNVRSRKGFLGNVGSYSLSYMLAVMHISLNIDNPSALARLSLSGLCFLIPIADACVVVTTRLFTVRSPFQADRGHLHHRLIQTSVPLRWILTNFALIELSSMVVAYLLTRHRVYVESNLPAYIGVGYLTIAAFLIILVEKASRRRLKTLFEALDSGEPIYFFKYRFTNSDGTPITIRQMKRVEARVSAEIRISDFCFSVDDQTLFVTVRTHPEPVKGVFARLENIFQSEKIHASHVVERGEFAKHVAQPAEVLPSKKTA